ncbi:MAG: Dabb family protein [Lentisphaeraceae bacterium]|nr:Dabb family protein [Lentisphaeraceae bacterium]
MFVHTVFFWLEKDLTEAQREAFKQGATTLTEIQPNVAAYLGVPAKTDRPVIDRTYDYSLTAIFESKEDQDLYQDHPVHLKFIENHAKDWAKVQVYDAE